MNSEEHQYPRVAVWFERSISVLSAEKCSTLMMNVIRRLGKGLTGSSKIFCGGRRLTEMQARRLLCQIENFPFLGT